GRIDYALHAIAELLRVARIGERAFDVAEGVRAIDRLDAGRAALDEKARANVSELHALAAALGAQVSDHVLARHQQRAHTLRCARDLHRAHEARSRFDVRYEPDAGRCGGFQPLYLLGHRDLRHHQHIG